MTLQKEQEEQPEGVNFVTSEDAVFVFKNYSPKQEEQRAAYRASQKMPEWKVKENIVISGMSGRFPESDTVKEFEDNLYNNVDMVVEDERRWPFGYLGLPKGCGKLKDISVFDHRFFHVNEYEANYMDSQVRIMLEITFEALWDAGLDPNSLAGTQTGFFLGNCFDEYLAAYAQDYTRVPDYRQCFFAMLANVYDFRGPCKPFDTACASGFSALHEAMVSLRSGQCERAIVVGLNLCLRAATQNQFLNLNMISPDGHCKCLDDDANGYAKGEACVAIVLQRKSEAKRIYATVVHTKTNCDGYKDLGITYPSFELQRELIEDTYHEVGLDPLDVDFCEAHCTGTQAGDPSEMRAIYEALCKGRTNPLLIGAIKSVIGHTEASSGLCSLVKTILCFEREIIPANLHMTTPNHRIEGLINGMLKPVNSNTPYTGRYIALNCFGFGGVNVHAVIEKHHNTQLKIEGSEANLPQQLPRLVTFCGRNQAMLEGIVDYMKNNPKELTPAFLSLLNDISKTSAFPNKMFKGMRHRAFLLLQEEADGSASVVADTLQCSKIKDKVKPPVCFVFTGMGSQWTAMGAQLKVFPVIKAALEKCTTTLKTIDPTFDLMHILTADNDELLKSSLNSFVAIAAIQIGLVDLLAQLDITAEYIVGHSIGELTCAYADGCLTAEETIAAAYWRGKCIENVSEGGAMAAVACTWKEAQQWCASLANGQVWPACHNGEDSVTVAGKKEHVEAFIEKLQQEKEGVFARGVNSSGVAFHSLLVEGIRTDLLARLTQVLAGKTTRERSSRWISSTYEEEKENDKSSAKLLDATYLVENLILPVRFHSALQQVPSNAVFLEIGPHHLLQAIIKRTLMGTGSTVKYVPSLSRQGDNPRSLLKMLGGLYAVGGLNPAIERLYPKVIYPVPRTTASLHSLIKWRHDRSFTVTQYPEFFNQTKLYESAKTVDITVGEEKYLTDHCIDSRVLFPATGYLFLAWTHVAKLLNVDYRELPVEFEDVNLHRATIIPKIGFTNFDIYFIEGTGQFTITEGGMLTTSGKIRVIPDRERSSMLKHQSLIQSIKELEGQTCQMEMKTKDIYKEFRLRGYDYGPEFQAVNYIRQVDQTLTAKVVFKNWVTFVDGLIQLAVLGQQTRGLFLPVRFNLLRCDPKLMFGDCAEDGAVRIFDAIYDGVLNIGVAPGIEYQGIKANLAPRKINQQPVEETFEFVAHDELNLPYIASRAVSEKRSQLMTDQLKCYQDMCTQVLMDRSKLPDEQLNTFLGKYEKEVTATPVLLKLAETLSEGSDQKAIESLEQDLLFRTYLTERFLRAQLETFCDNLIDTNVQVLEVNQTPTIMASTMLNWLLLSSFKITFTYQLLHSALDKFSLNLDSTHSQHEWLAEKSKFPTDLVNIDLIIYKDSSTCPLLAQHKVNFDSLLESMWNTLIERGFALIILRDRPFEVEKKLAEILKKDGCIDDTTSRVAEFESAIEKSPFHVISHKSDVFGVHVYMVRKVTVEIVVEEQIFMNINNTIATWFTDLQEKIREINKVEENNGTVSTVSTRPKNIWLLANDATSGVIGFVSCLHKEPLGYRVRCILNTDIESTPSIDLQSPTVQKIIKQDLFMNTLGPKGVPGGYKHFTLPLEDYEPRPTEHCYINTSTRGDLASLKWFESQHKHWPINQRSNQVLCHVYYSALNFRDIMLATGKLPPDALPTDIGLDDCVLGLEFAGRDENGNRVMGMLAAKGLATTLIMESQQFLWPIPPQWSMEEAATVPVAYATAYYALIIRGKLQPGEAVLIHSGSGAVGQAAIAICIDMNCRLFITVGSDEKRDILMQIFPSLKANQFASSRNIEFSRKILRETNGRGVDLVLNSLAEEKLQESVNCLAEFGRFLEIGKYDLSQNTNLDLSKIMANKTFHGILLDNLLNFGPKTPKLINQHRDLIWTLMRAGIEKGVVRPLDRTIFAADQAEDAFRYMANGKHIGKVLVCIRPEEKADAKGIVNISTEMKLPAIPRTVFFAAKSYIITGGLGGFGLELINWMMEREAKNFVVTSRTGVKDLYQKTRLEYFARKGAKVKIFTGDASIESGADELVKEAESLGPLGGVFHLAMVLSDGLFDNQTVASFETATKPKADTFTHLDRITQKRCKEVDYFVAFSSVSCGVGNPGQTNYGFANSVMERICEQRRRKGLHGFAIQWGAIGDVGYIIDNIRGNEVVICGSIPQRMPSCLAALDRLLQSPFSVCSNLIKMDYKFEACGKSSLIKTISHILGIKDYETLEANLTLGELGMDSLMGVEVKQAIERDYDVVLSMGDVRKLTIGKIREIGAGKAKHTADSADPSATGEGARLEAKAIDESLMPTAAVTYLNDIVNGDPIIFLPQIDATYEQMLPIAAKLNRPAIGLNWTKECKDLKTVPSVANHYIEVIERTLPHLESNYDLLGYSFGGIIAIEMGIQLHNRPPAGRLGPYRKLILLDSSPKQFKIFTDEAVRKFNISDRHNDQAFVESILMFLLAKLAIDYGKIKEILLSLEDTAKRIEFVRDLFKQLQGLDIQSETLEFLIQSHFNKMVMMNQYECSEKSLPGDLMLIRASTYLVADISDNVKDDYWLSEIITGKCHVHVLNGDHKTFVTDNYSQLTEIIRNYYEL